MEPTSDDLLVAGLVVITALVAFIAVLYLNRKDAKDIVAVTPEQIEGGTVLKEEGGRVVRRSTRQHKAPQLDGVYKSPSAKTPRSSRSAADAVATPPTVAARSPRAAVLTSPTRGTRAAKSPGAAKRSKSPAATLSSPATTPRRRGRPPKARQEEA